MAKKQLVGAEINKARAILELHPSRHTIMNPCKQRCVI